ncbi:hypothetical protein BDV39DRAFT_179419 [Aspergillus sergii]|uniref:Uncharacterized protein n=1 Tax=Aspergillus sergii TaxID=1034303 RepID=A0A5N6WW47_9EURO|nr:hypothetical protein BDV39DRAFT_179419 [Aspergillus sergii]
MDGSGRLRLEFVIARSWFWVRLWWSAPVDPRPISIFFCTVTEHFHGITKISGWASLFLFVFFPRLRFSLSGSPCTEDLVAMWNGVRLRSWIRVVVYHGYQLSHTRAHEFRNRLKFSEVSPIFVLLSFNSLRLYCIVLNLALQLIPMDAPLASQCFLEQWGSSFGATLRVSG